MSLLSLGQLQLRRLAALGKRGLFRSLLRRELIQPGDGARRLLVGRFELLALGRVLVDLAEDLGGWKSVAMVRRYRKIVDERLDDVMDAFYENGKELISEQQHRLSKANRPLPAGCCRRTRLYRPHARPAAV